MLITMLILTAIGLIAAILIYIVSVVVPRKVEGLEKIEEVNEHLPGMDCGAWAIPAVSPTPRQ